MLATILGCIAFFVVIKFAYAWISRPRTNIHVHVPAPQATAVYYPIPVVMESAEPAVERLLSDEDAELHGMIDDYYRDHRPRP